MTTTSDERAAFDERFERACHSGRVVLVGPSCRVVRDGPLLIAGRCEAPEFESAIRWISRFAFGLAAIVAGLVAIEAIPRLFGLISLGWFVPALVARAYARARARRLGCYLLDLDLGRIEHRSVRGVVRHLDTEELRVTTYPAAGELWVVAHAGRGAPIALGRGVPDDSMRLVMALRQQRLRVDSVPLED